MKELFKQLDENINSHDEIVIMTHARSELDGMGSAICLSEIVSFKGKKCCIVKPYEKINRSLKKAFKYLESNNIEIKFKSEEEILNDNGNKLLIIVDTQKSDFVESEKVLNSICDKIVIDHHIDGIDSICDVIYKYNDINKSSVVEIMGEYLNYLKLAFNPFIMTVMLGGMVTDTSSFSLKVTYKTFEVASFLIKNGASMDSVGFMLKEPREEMTDRYEFIKNSKEVMNNVLLCQMDDKIHSNVDIAMLAKELLKFENVKASFAIGFLSKRVIGVSARSVNDINVGKIMESLGGGGRATDAACQIKDKSISEVALMVINALKEEEKCE